MKNRKYPSAKTAGQLAKLLGLGHEDAIDIEFRRNLNDKIISIVTQKNLTHTQVAKLAKASRTRVTAILNRNTHGISTDLLLRILAALGYRAKLSFSPIKRKLAA